MRGNAQPDGRPPLYDGRQNFVTKCENVRYCGNRDRLGASLNGTKIKLVDPETCRLVQESRNFLLQKSSYRL